MGSEEVSGRPAVAVDPTPTLAMRALSRLVEEPPLIVITGMSGAGRSTAAKVLEDLGWFVVDNLPPQLQDLRHQAMGEGSAPMRLAAVIDARAGKMSGSLSQTLVELRADGDRPVVVFLDATDEALVRRFESVRRPHPLQGAGRLMDAISGERVMMADLRASADLIIDTSGFNVHQLAAKISSLLSAAISTRVRLAVVSFGFKYGVPLDADIVMDMRFLPNPYWVESLRAQNGRDAAVAEFVLRQDGAAEFLDRMVAMLEPVVAGYQREGRRYATVAIGCTGGKHRSVAMSEALLARLDAVEAVDAFIVHRDLGRE